MFLFDLQNKQGFGPNASDTPPPASVRCQDSTEAMIGVEALKSQLSLLDAFPSHALSSTRFAVTGMPYLPSLHMCEVSLSLTFSFCMPLTDGNRAMPHKIINCPDV